MQEIIKPGYVRVSAILQQWDKFGGIDANVLARKAEIGTNVHKIIENHVKRQELEIGSQEAGYFASYLEWEKVTKPRFVQTETRYYDDALKITGQVDAMAHFGQSEQLIILDYKTSAQPENKLWPLQGAFYHRLACGQATEQQMRVIFLKLDKNGAFPKLFEYQVNSSIWGICLAALTTYRYLEK